MKVVGTRRVWSPEEVTEAIARRLDDAGAFWVEAEIDDIRRSGSQVYFQLRGGHMIDASMRGAVFDRIGPPPRPGALVHAHGRIEFFRPRARVSMRVEVMELAGEGLLRARIDELRRRLRSEGLLRAGRERPLPLLPRRIGLVTSPVGAARDDFVTNARARFPQSDILIAPTAVQGDGAPAQIADAITRVGRADGIEVVVVTRGGGSLEDLMAFNSEPVCRAIAACPVPVVSAVGHERDTTLCDEVADRRVSTPTAAAVAVTPSREALDVHLADCLQAMNRGLSRSLADADRRLRVRGVALGGGLTRAVEAAERTVAGVATRLRPATDRALGAADQRLSESGARARRAMSGLIGREDARLAGADALLRTLSPQATVARGYAIVRDPGTGAVVVDAAAVHARQELTVQLRDGDLAVRVEEGEDGL
jgi:exodeoxyribonuclease VII large subunit